MLPLKQNFKHCNICFSNQSIHKVSGFFNLIALSGFGVCRSVYFIQNSSGPPTDHPLAAPAMVQEMRPMQPYQKRRKSLKTLPEKVLQEWETREGPFVLTTVDSNGIPNSIYVTCVNKTADGQIVVADNKMHKTQANIMAGSPVSLLFLTKERKAFQLKGSASYQTSGKLFEEMKTGWLDKKYPGRAAVVIDIEEVYSGAEKLA